MSLGIPVIVQRVLGSVIDACSRLPRRISVFHWNGEEGGFIQHVQFCSMYVVLAMILTPNMFSYAVLPWGGLCHCVLDNPDLLGVASTHCDLLLVRNRWLSLSQLRWLLFVFSVRALPHRLQPKVVLSPH